MMSIQSNKQVEQYRIYIAFASVVTGMTSNLRYIVNMLIQYHTNVHQLSVRRA
jgi:hypothetical protein